MKWYLSVVCAALLSLAARAAIVESAPWGSFALDTRSQSQCLTPVGADAVAAGRGLWDVTGAYTATVDGSPLTLDLVHDIQGKLTGTATLTLSSGKGLVPVPLSVRGSARGAAGALALTLALQGTEAANGVRVTLSLRLALDAAARQLSGTISGSRSVHGVTTPLAASPVALAIPAALDGTWALQLDLVWGDRGVRGTGLLSLSNGVTYVHTVSGTYVGDAALLTLAGRPAYLTARSTRIRATVAPLEGAAARLTAFSGTLYGQALEW